jgi:hypothetical protein
MALVTITASRISKPGMVMRPDGCRDRKAPKVISPSDPQSALD